MANETDGAVEAAEPKRRGRPPAYPKGPAPWTLAGISRSTFDRRQKVEASPARASQQDAPAEPTGGGEAKPATIEAAPIEVPTPQRKPVEAPAGAAPVATVNVSLRSPKEQHDRLREMHHRTRRSIQDIVASAVDRYLDAEGF